ncbi:CAP domain-containing protein [Actinophytocola oryzae]|uniref:Uncharacterized protein YkwD n=1 Tax=Actinophytocola oryzae TaxID=502181 RepID=A0A4R7UUW0_9PSEU|nr:CAP domain-containing protein [Actinophytocola oryzae]TDV39797.1 uncharacterized protein YkwD [Actinophytocola oryzae]
MRARRPVLPALTAVFAGALVAGAATLLSGHTDQTSADQGLLGLDGTSTQRPDSAGGRLRQPETTSTRASSSDSDPTSPTSTTQQPPATTTTTEAPAPPPAETDDPPPAPPAPDLSAQEQVVSLTNNERGQAGCDPLTIDADITAAAQGHASDMAERDYFEHTTPDGVTFDQRIRNAGYASPGAENIAKGADTAAQVVELWMNSPGHRANILNCDLKTIGIGLDRDGFYWVQDFGF